ncbi:MAG TPA: helix-turn-helix transcriptional regulator [Candidatus Atribacteria bacterium]|jgi:transcriptional regulator of acetoin/glycerol metabolism|nr:MAG: Transcriptional activator of acetoin/glycerol metabolism [Atribacteria bacterium 34_128]HAJ32180.1 helix-turn-helix transcriptional regulator [Candidatus Atribacteria bacterium]
MEFFIPQDEVVKAWQRCIKNGLNSTINKPQHFLSGRRLKEKFNKYDEFIRIFKDCIDDIINLITGNYFFLLTDKDTILLSIAGDNSLTKRLVNNGIKPGISFQENSCGINAICLASQLKRPVYLTPEQHFCKFFRKWYCAAVPLKILDKTIGYLDVSTIAYDMQKEQLALVKLLSDKILNELKFPQFSKYEDMLSKQEKEILVLLAKGKTEDEIANRLFCTKETIKYHKHQIFTKLDVKNASAAIGKISGFSAICSEDNNKKMI